MTEKIAEAQEKYRQEPDIAETKKEYLSEQKLPTLRITDMPKEERPREKLLQRGAPALTNVELLAIFLRTGVRGKSALDLAKDLLGRVIS